MPFGVSYLDVSQKSGFAARRSDGLFELAGDLRGVPVNVPPLAQGTSYVQVLDGGYRIAARIGATSTYVSFAHGCAGSRPASQLIPRDTPRIGRGMQINILDAPTNFAIMAFGWSRTPGPIDFSPVGMPGCSFHVAPDATILLGGANRVVPFSLSIPSWSGLVGMRFCNQALVLDPAANAAGAVLSDAAEGTIGNL